LANVLIGQGNLILCVVSTEIAATLLIPLDRTFHSQFKLFPPINETTTSEIRDTSLDAKRIREASFIIWNDATMTTKHALNAVDIFLRERRLVAKSCCLEGTFGSVFLLFFWRHTLCKK